MMFRVVQPISTFPVYLQLHHLPSLFFEWSLQQQQQQQQQQQRQQQPPRPKPKSPWKTHSSHCFSHGFPMVFPMANRQGPPAETRWSCASCTASLQIWRSAPWGTAWRFPRARSFGSLWQSGTVVLGGTVPEKWRILDGFLMDHDFWWICWCCFFSCCFLFLSYVLSWWNVPWESGCFFPDVFFFYGRISLHH